MSKKTDGELTEIAEVSWGVYRKSITAYEPERGTLHLAEIALKGAVEAEKLKLQRETLEEKRQASNKGEEAEPEVMTESQEDKVQKLFSMLAGRQAEA